MADEISVTFHCKKCGGTVLTLTNGDADDSIAKCKACGEDFGPWREVQAEAERLAQASLDKSICDAFKGLKGWKIK